MANKHYHYSVEVVYREEFAVEADSKEAADMTAQDMFDDRDSAVWDAIDMGDPDTDRLVYEGYSVQKDSVLLNADARELCVTIHPKERRAESWA